MDFTPFPSTDNPAAEMKALGFDVGGATDPLRMIGIANQELRRAGHARRWRMAFPKGVRDRAAMRWLLVDEQQAKELAARGEWDLAPAFAWPLLLSLAFAIVAIFVGARAFRHPEPANIGIAAALYVAWFAVSRFMRKRMLVPR
jgi:hypothetical protein